MDLAEQSKLLNSEQNSVAAGLKREASVLLLGAAEGYANAGVDRLSNHKLQTASELTISAALTYGLVRAANSGPAVRYAAALTGGALSFSFAKNVLSNFSETTNQLKEVVQSTWNNDSNLEANKDKVANLVGPFLFDTSVALAGGIAGGRLANRQGAERAVMSLMEERFGAQINESVFRAISSPQKDGLRYFGSAYAVQSDKLATAFHVVKDDPSRAWMLTRSGENLQANVLAAHPYYDLALFGTTNSRKLNPLPLANLAERDSAAGIIVGSPGGNGIKWKPASFSQGRLPTGSEYNTVYGRETAGGFIHAINGGSGRRGMSGGPSILETGEVVGTLSSIYPVGKIVGAGTASIPSETLSSLMRLVEKSQNPQFNFSSKEAAAKLGLTEAVVLSKLREAKLPGFLVPQGDSRWQWRVILEGK